MQTLWCLLEKAPRACLWSPSKGLSIEGFSQSIVRWSSMSEATFTLPYSLPGFSESLVSRVLDKLIAADALEQAAADTDCATQSTLIVWKTGSQAGHELN